MVPLKRKRVTGSTSTGDPPPTKFPQVVLFLLERKMGASRRAFLSQLGTKNGFRVEEAFSPSVTHVISEKNLCDEVRTWLSSQRTAPGRAPLHLLDISWFTESMHAGRPLPVLDRHKLQVYSTHPVTWKHTHDG